MPLDSSGPVGPGRRTRRRELFETEILDAAATVFAARGFAGTSMQDIAETLEISRPSLYHYFQNKEELLSRLMTGLADGARRAVNRAKHSTEPADLTLRSLIIGLILPIAESPGRFRLLQTTDATVSVDTNGVMTALERDVVRTMSATIAAGVAAGLFRRCDERITTMSLLGMVNWVAWWYVPSHEDGAAELAESIADLAIASIRTEEKGRSGASARDIISSVQRDLQLLSRLTETGP